MISIKEYLAFHTKIYLQIAKNNGTNLYLKKVIVSNGMTFFKKEYLLLSIDPNLKKEMSTEDLKICDVYHIDDVLKNKEVKKALKSNTNIKFELSPTQEGFAYLNQLIKLGNKDEIVYFFLKVYELNLKSGVNEYNQRMLTQIAKHQDSISIIKEILDDKGMFKTNHLNLEEITTQLRVAKMLKEIFTNQDQDLTLGFEKMLAVITKSHILKLFKEISEKNILIHSNPKLNFLKDWIPYLNQRKDCIEIINEFFQEIKVNNFQEHYQIKARDIVMEFFPNNTKAFEWMNIFILGTDSVFVKKEMRTAVPIEINIHQLQKVFLLNNGTSNIYINLLEVLSDVLPKIENLNINDIYKKTLVKEEKITEKWMLILHQPSATIQYDIENLIIAYISSYITSLHLFENMNDTDIMKITTLKDKIDETHLIDWIKSYWFNYRLKEELNISGNDSNQPKL